MRIQRPQSEQEVQAEVSAGSVSPSFDVVSALRGGAWWLGSGTVAIRLFHVALTVVMLQTLSYGEMGLWAAAWSVMVVVEAVNGLGINFAVVRLHDLSEATIRGLSWISVTWNLAMAILLAAAAPHIANWYGEPALAPLLFIVCLKVILMGPTMVPSGLINKRLGFRDAATADVFAGIIEAVTSIVLVLAGFGAFGMVWGTTARAFVYLVVVLVIEPVRPGFNFLSKEVGRALSFGTHVAATNLFYHAYRNADYFLIGLRLGISPLGIYRAGFQIGMTPFETISTVTKNVSYPVFSKVATDSNALESAFAHAARSLWLFLVPIAVLFAVESHDLVATIAKEQWLAAVPIVQILCWGGLLRALVQLFPPLLQAAGHPRLALYDSLITGTLLVTGFGLSTWLAPADTAIRWIAWVWVFAYPIVLCFDLAFARRSIGFRMQTLARALAPLVFAAPVMYAVMTGVSGLLPAWMNAPARLSLVGALGGGAFLMCKWLFPGTDTTRTASRLLRKRSP